MRKRQRVDDEGGDDAMDTEVDNHQCAANMARRQARNGGKAISIDGRSGSLGRSTKTMGTSNDEGVLGQLGTQAWVGSTG